MKKIEKITDILFELLGPEDGLKLIEIDACHDNWLFYRYSSDTPARCVAYLKQCGLANPQILELVSEYGYILNLFGKKSAEAKVDSIIDRFLYEWARHHGPCYDGLTLEEIDFLIHGPGKLES